MKKIKDMKIGHRLNLLLGMCLVIIFVFLGAYIYNQQKKIIADTDVRMVEQVNDLQKLIQLQIKERLNQIELSHKFAIQIFNNLGKLHLRNDLKKNVLAVNQASKAMKEISLPSFLLGNKFVFNTTTIVDSISKITHTQVTIFQKIDGGFLRIATTILKSEGIRAVGTYIPDSSYVIQTIEKGKIFNGRAFVVNDWYLTCYAPLFFNGKVVGMIFVGVPEKDLKDLKTVFYNKKYFESGYPFIIDNSGNLIIHPTSEGQQFKNEAFFKQIISSKKETGKINYSKQGPKRILYYKYVPEIESYVVVSVVVDEMLKIVREIQNAILIALLICIVTLVFLNSLITRSLSRSVKKGVEFAKRLSEGDLTGIISIDQKDEIGELTNALLTIVRTLSENLEKEMDLVRVIEEHTEHLKETLEKAELSDKLKTSFLLNLSHEILTPLNAIMGFATLLKTENDPATQHSYISIINSSCKQFMDIIHDILDISLIQNNDVCLKYENISLNKIVSEVFHSIETILGSNNHLQLNHSQGISEDDILVLTDGPKVKQIIANLLSNAIKFSEKGVIEIGYALKDSSVEFYVKDDGIGIETKNHAMIFEKFNRISESNTKLYRGNGLGLPIAKAYVELLGGTIWLNSELNKGSVFYFTIPYLTPKIK